jgi:tight adherence protein B
MLDLPPITIALVVFVIILGLAMMVFLLRSQGESARSRQMAIISGRGQQRDDTNDRGMKDRRRSDLAKKLKDGGGDEGQKKENRHSIKDRIVYAGLKITQAQFWMASFASAAIFFLISILFHFPPIAHILMAIIGLLGFPRFVLNFMAGRRQKKFLEEFADALESMVRLLKAGMPVGEAIAMVSREFHGPVGEEMARVYEAQKIGVPMGEAVLLAARRMPITEMQMFATGINIQQQTGASLSDVLMNLAAMIRARFRLKRKVHALSAEAKASAAIIGALPVIVSVGLYFLNPDYISLLFTTPKGKIMVSIAIGWMMVGVFVMRQMINFKV